MKTDSKAVSLSRRNFLKAAGVSFLAAVPAWGKSARPNVLLLFSDQHKAGVMGCAGHPVVKTPHLDRLAEIGVRFDRAYCQDAICVPSRTSFMTGLYPRTTGCLDNPNKPPGHAGLFPLQHIFQRNGYRTGCFGKRHMPNIGRLALGWDRSATTTHYPGP